MNQTAQKTAVVYGVIFILSLCIYFLFLVRGVVFDLILALFVAVAMERLIRFVGKAVRSRTWAILSSYILLLLLLALLLSVIAVPLTTQTLNFVGDAPRLIDSLGQNSMLHSLEVDYHALTNLKTYIQELPSHLASFSGQALGILGGIVSGFTEFIIVLTMALFLSLEGPVAWKVFLDFFKKESSEHVSRVVGKMTLAVSGFVSGNLFVSLIAAVVAVITLFIFNVPYVLPLAVLVGLLDLIPLVGAAIATVVVGLVALTQGLSTAVIVVVVLLAYQFVESHVINTLVYSKTVSLSPLLTIIAGLIGAETGGVLGVVLAIPTAAALQVLVKDLWDMRRKSMVKN